MVKGGIKDVHADQAAPPFLIWSSAKLDWPLLSAQTGEKEELVKTKDTGM